MCPSLPIIWKLLWLVGWPVWLLWWWIAEGVFRWSLHLLPKVLEVSPMYSSSQPRSPHWYQYMAPLWLTMGSLSLGETRRFLMVLPWVHPFLGHHCQTWGWWHTIHHCVQETYTLTSTCSGIVTITSQPNLVSSTPSPIEPKHCAASLSCSNSKRTTSGRLLPNANIPNGLWTRWRKDSTDLPVRSLMGLTTKALQLPKLPLMESKLRVTLSYPTHEVFVKASKRSVVDMAFKPTSKVAAPSRTSWSPPRTKTPWSTKVVPYTGTNVVI